MNDKHESLQPTPEANPLAGAKREEIRRIVPALERAARDARRIARQTGTHLIVVEHGEVVAVPPGEIEDSDADDG